MSIYVEDLGEDIILRRDVEQILHPDTGKVIEKLSPLLDYNTEMRRGAKGALLYALNYVYKLQSRMKLNEGFPEKGKDVLVIYKQKGKDEIEVHEGYLEGEYGNGKWSWHIYCLDGFITEKDVDFVFWTYKPEVVRDETISD